MNTITTLERQQYDQSWSLGTLHNWRRLFSSKPPTHWKSRCPVPRVAESDIKTNVIDTSWNARTVHEDLGTQEALEVVSKGTYRLNKTRPYPELINDDEIVIRNKAVGLNPIDWKSVDYNFCLPAYPWVTGRECSGIVEKIGPSVTRFKVGDRVWTSK